MTIQNRDAVLFRPPNRMVLTACVGGLLGAGPASTRIFGICSGWLASWLGCAASRGGARAHIVQLTPHFSECNFAWSSPTTVLRESILLFSRGDRRRTNKTEDHSLPHLRQSDPSLPQTREAALRPLRKDPGSAYMYIAMYPDL